MKNTLTPAVLCLLAVCAVARAQDRPVPVLALTEAEQAWIKAHPVVRIGVDRE